MSLYLSWSELHVYDASDFHVSWYFFLYSNTIMNSACINITDVWLSGTHWNMKYTKILQVRASTCTCKCVHVPIPILICLWMCVTLPIVVGAWSMAMLLWQLLSIITAHCLLLLFIVELNNPIGIVLGVRPGFVWFVHDFKLYTSVWMGLISIDNWVSIVISSIHAIVYNT